MDNSGGISSGGMDSGGEVHGAEINMENSFEQAPEVEQPEKVEGIITQDPTESGIGKKDSDKIMKFHGTAHDKLMGLADMSDKNIDLDGQSTAGEDDYIFESEIQNDEDSEQEPQVRNEEKPEKREDSIFLEDQLIKLQAETIKMMTEKMNTGKIDFREYEELLKRLENLLKDMEEQGVGQKSALLTGALSVIMMLTKAAEDGTKKLENEIQEAEK